MIYAHPLRLAKKELREQAEECMEYIQQHITNVTMACEFRGSSTTPTWRQQTLSPY